MPRRRRSPAAPPPSAPLAGPAVAVAPLVLLLAAWVLWTALEAALWRRPLWGAHFIAYLAPAWWASVPLALAALGALAWPRRRDAGPPAPEASAGARPGAAREQGSTLPRWAPLAAAVAAAALFWSLRVRHLFWGDALPLSIEIPRGLSFHPDEPLAVFLHQLLYRAAGGRLDGAEAVALGSVLAGALFVGRTVQWLGRRAPDRATALLAALALITQGFTQVFYGYVENYAYLATALLFFATWGVDFLEGRIGPLRPLAAALVACALHILGWLTLPAALAIVGVGLATPGRRARTAVAVAVVGAAAIAALELTTGLYGDAAPVQRFAGGVRKVLLAGGAAPASRWLAPRTLADVWSLLVLVGPLSLPLLVPWFAALRGPRFAHTAAGAFLLGFALLATLPMLFLGGWGLGPARDWDIFAAPAVAPALAGVLLVLAAARGADARRLLAAVAVASLAHTAPWIALNTDRERAMERVAELPLGRGRGSMMLGTHFLNAGDLDAAIRWFRRSLAEDSTNLGSQSGLGLALARSGRREEALEPMRRAVALHPYRAELRRDLAALLFTLGRWEEAAAEGQALVRLDPSSGGDWRAIAACHERLGRLDQAAQVLEAGLAALPADAALREALAECYGRLAAERLRAGDRQGAQDAVARLAARFPADPRIDRWRAALAAPPGEGGPAP